MESDAVYYGRRAREERQAACVAPKPSVRDRHLELAQAYELRTRFLLAEPLPQEMAGQPMLLAG